ncbi:pentapeptide repeat-containing protein [Alkalinema pantanalense CENA528]|uniref:pentapeptide repeat-containing protein n=1 Tax=Alkalinema pantanalense TaxID=1620705 RepID=UPI003D6EE00A
MTLDFSGQNLRGHNFKGQDLTGANFSYADIRGANFSNAILVNTNFRSTIAGLQKRWLFILVIISFFLAAISAGIAIVTALEMLAYAFVLLTPEHSLSALVDPQGKMSMQQLGATISIFRIMYPTLTVIKFILFVTFCAVTVKKGLIVSIRVILIIFGILAFIGASVGALSGALFGAALGASSLGFIGFFLGGLTGLLIGALYGVGMLTVFLAFFGGLTLILLLTAILFASLSIAGANILAGFISGIMVEAVAVAMAFILTLTLLYSILSQYQLLNLLGISLSISAATVAVIVIILSGYIGRQAISMNEKYRFILNIASAFIAAKGTKFKLANLTDADFTNATLKNTNFSKSILKRTRFFQVKKLEFAFTEETYLKNRNLQLLVVTGNGRNKNFDRKDLRGLNLSKANLSDASFIGTDLSESALQEADLSRAKLVQARLDRTDLTRACLTGAYIEDWGVTGETKLDGVRCEYVYMHLPTEEDPDPVRKPDNRQEIFSEGDFTDFIKPLMNTLDLYHNSEVDPRSIAIAFKRLSENNPEAELEIVALEKRGRDKFLLRAKTSDLVDKSELSAQYFSNYNQIKALPHDNIQLLLAAQDDRIQSLEGMVMTALKQPKFYAETYRNQGAFMSEQSGTNISIGGDVTGSTINLGEISGSVSNVVNRLPNSPNPDQPGIKELLIQLQAAIEEATELSLEDKADLLEQVQALAEVKQMPDQERKEGLVRKAKKMFEATLRTLPDTAKIMEACSKLLPMILKALGFSM